MNYLIAHSSGHMGLKENLKALMDKHGENPHSLATKSKVTQPTIFRILSGDSKEPRRSNVEKLAKFFGVKPEEMYCRLPEQLAAKQDTAIYTISKVASTGLSNDEQTILEGFRVADRKDKEQILWLANRAIDVFEKRSEKN